MSELTTYAEEIKGILAKLMGVDKSFLTASHEDGKVVIKTGRPADYSRENNIVQHIQNRLNDTSMPSSDYQYDHKNGVFTFKLEDKFDTVQNLSDKAFEGIANRTKKAIDVAKRETLSLSDHAGVQDSLVEKLIGSIIKQANSLNKTPPYRTIDR